MTKTNEVPAYMRQTKSSMVKERKVDEQEASEIMKTDKTFKPPLLYKQDSAAAGRINVY